MSTYNPEEDANWKVTCPFEPNHLVLRKRLGNHILKCYKNHPEYKRCPFNAQHYLKEDEYRQHLERCPNRAIIDRFLVDGASNGQDNSSAPPVEDNHFSSRPPSDVASVEWHGEECWDDDDDESNHCKPEEKLKSQSTIFTSTQGWKRAQRQKHYEKLKDRSMKKPEEPSEESEVLEGTSAGLGSEEQDYLALVRGRGQVPGEIATAMKKSRLGAKFPGVQPPPAASATLIQRTAIGRGKAGCNLPGEKPSTLSQAFKDLSLNTIGR